MKENDDPKATPDPAPSIAPAVNPFVLTPGEAATLQLLTTNQHSITGKHSDALREIANAEGMVQGALRAIVVMRGLDGDWNVRDGILVRA